MSTKIYFPSINAEAVIDADIKRGGTASVCYMWDGFCYIGKIRKIKFTVSRPKNWNNKNQVDYLKHIPEGGFAYVITRD